MMVSPRITSDIKTLTLELRSNIRIKLPTDVPPFYDSSRNDPHHAETNATTGSAIFRSNVFLSGSDEVRHFFISPGRIINLLQYLPPFGRLDPRLSHGLCCSGDSKCTDRSGEVNHRQNSFDPLWTRIPSVLGSASQPC